MSDTRDYLKIEIPFSPTWASATLQMPTVTEDEWDQIMRVLQVIKPGLVKPSVKEAPYE
jgi:hypothetical protein